MVLFNGENIVGGQFPNKEKYYKPLNSEINRDTFTLIFESNEDLFDLLLYKKYYDDMYPLYGVPSLIASFLPYGQADRSFPDKIFSFKYVAQLINDANFAQVIITDPHSRVMEAAIDRCVVVNANPFGYTTKRYNYFVYPDDGAMEKYSEIFSYEYIYGIKKRDLKTGKIISYEMNVDKSQIEGRDVLIIDDICMGGMSFKKCAELLKQMGARTVDLYITHLMPQAEEFYDTYKDYGIDNFYSENTLRMPWYE